LFRKTVFCLLCLVFLGTFGRGLFAYSSAQSESIPSFDRAAFNTPAFDGYLRIGLEQYFLERPQINIYSRHLEIGVFMVIGPNGGHFHVLGNLATDSHFSAIPANMPLARLPLNFSTLNEAQMAAELFPGATPALLGDGNHDWGLFLPLQYADMFGATPLPASNRRVALTTNGNLVLISENENLNLQIRDIGGITGLGVRQYRGIIELARFRGQNLTAVNIVHIDEYLYSVVPSEMPALWPAEALRAQAVAARTFTFYRKAGWTGRDYNLCDTVFSQVYSGVGREHENSTRAVRETHGLIMTYDGRPIFAAYSSCAGGHTANSADVWGSALPYLIGRPEIHPATDMLWERTITLSQINQLLNNANIHIGPAASVEIITNNQGRVMQFIIHGQTGSHILERETIRTFFNASQGGGLRSRMFTIVGGTILQGQQTADHTAQATYVLSAHGIVRAPQALYFIDASGVLQTTALPAQQAPIGGALRMTSSGYYINLQGRGWGHGVGMSQHGARAMANAGYDFRQILLFYYQGVEIVQHH
jgi:stage II sporulation protein D